tara:strand:+ start:84829 stop:84993 length:165 start_codon:yes stop_codon:yes gene_type:complete
MAVGNKLLLAGSDSSDNDQPESFRTNILFVTTHAIHIDMLAIGTNSGQYRVVLC